MCGQAWLRLCGYPQIGRWLLLVVLAFGVVATALLLLVSQFVPTWNCIIMRDQEVVEQPMVMETVPQRLLAEAQGFIQRWDGRITTPRCLCWHMGKLELLRIGLLMIIQRQFNQISVATIFL